MGANASGEEGGAPIENKRTLRIHLVLEVSIPEGTMLFQALTLAFWRFQGLAVPTLFTAVVQAIEARTQTELTARFPGRFRNKGSQPRRWQCPFGLVQPAVLQSFRQSRKAAQGLAPAGRAPRHHTLHRRFQGLAATILLKGQLGSRYRAHCRPCGRRQRAQRERA